jgi:hypothetical protein
MPSHMETTKVKKDIRIYRKNEIEKYCELTAQYMIRVENIKLYTIKTKRVKPAS